jgi:biotin-dependent carboxylase-like uncharacterized protein
VIDDDAARPRPTARPAFVVLAPGLLTTIQDAGRRGFEHLGVPRSGAADVEALAVANILVGNERGDAALECTLLGPRLRVARSITIAIAGADFGAVVEPDARRLEPMRTYRLHEGDVLDLVGEGGPTGCRAYVAVAGGIEVPIVLGSRSTSLVGAFGGFDGRPLRSGDTVLAASEEGSGEEPAQREWPKSLATPTRRDDLVRHPVRVVGESSDTLAGLLATTWTVSAESDRRGLRLDVEAGPGILSGHVADRPSHGVVPGSIQIAPSGQPLVLMPDAGTTGGYPVIAVVASVDLPLLGQLVPGTALRFEAIGLDAARAALADRDRMLADAERLLANGTAHARPPRRAPDG